MASRYSAARPKRAGESFARSHHGERVTAADNDETNSKKVKFDLRNPSALAPEVREDDDVLDADVIGAGGAATKRGAVNIDGYDSDSDNDTFQARADSRKGSGKGKGADDGVDLAEQLDNYNSRLKGDAAAGGAKGDDDDDDDDDMFGEDDDDDDADKTGRSAEAASTGQGKKDKSVRFLDHKDIQGQEQTSRSGGHIRLDDESSSDEEEAELAKQEEDVDEEVGAGGLKKHAPKIDAFNMRQEYEEGAFDESGNFIRKAVDPDSVHDRWLEGVSKKEMKKAAAAHERREEERRQQRRADDTFLTSDLLETLLTRLDKGETALEALARLAKGQVKPKAKKVPKWKQKKQKDADGAMEVDREKQPEDAAQVRIRGAISAITEAADRLLKRDYPDIYDTEREMLVREYRNETGEHWVDPPPPDPGEDSAEGKTAPQWEFRWTDGRDDTDRQGPFDGPTMQSWQAAGYFNDSVEFRRAGEEGGWTRVATFV